MWCVVHAVTSRYCITTWNTATTVASLKRANALGQYMYLTTYAARWTLCSHVQRSCWNWHNWNLGFHGVVERHVWCVLQNLVTFTCKVSLWSCQWKDFENQFRFAEVMTRKCACCSFTGTRSSTHGVLKQIHVYFEALPYISSKFSFFQAKRTKYWKFYIIKTTELIPTKFCTILIDKNTE